MCPWDGLDNPVSIYAAHEPTVPAIFASPHSGRHYPKRFCALTDLDDDCLRSAEDAWVDQLFDFIPKTGARLICARFPRIMIDVNRHALDLDARMYKDPVKTWRFRHNARISAGIGLIPSVVRTHLPIYAGKIPFCEARDRLHYLYTPYHQALRTSIDAVKARFGHALLIDCHSMPSSCAHTAEKGRVDIVLGDRHGRACAPVLIDTVQTAFEKAGYKVARNTPYAGGYTTAHYGRPEEAVHALQIEIARDLYMDEQSLIPHEGFTTLHTHLHRISKAICQLANVKTIF